MVEYIPERGIPTILAAGGYLSRACTFDTYSTSYHAGSRTWISSGLIRTTGPDKLRKDTIRLNISKHVTNAHTVLIVHTIYFPEILPSWSLDELKISFVPLCDCGNLGSWKSSEGMK